MNAAVTYVISDYFQGLSLDHLRRSMTKIRICFSYKKAY